LLNSFDIQFSPQVSKATGAGEMIRDLTLKRHNQEGCMKASAIVTVIFLLIVSVAHLLRLIFQTQIMVNTSAVPMWMSAAACIVTAALAIWLWTDNRKPGPSPS
jgi:uncharacterized membrane protein